MAKIYGQLEKAQLELLSASPPSAPTGYIYYDTTENQAKIKTPTGFSTVASLGLPPIGSIMAWAGGYMTGSSNSGFTSVLGNTVASVNALINGDGYYVCDGSVLNDASSSIFNGSNRYLPNLTGNRFLQGSTVAGTAGGQNSVTLAVTNLPGFSISTENTGVSSLMSGPAESHTHLLLNTSEARSRNAVGTTSFQYALNDPAGAGSWTANGRADFPAAGVASGTSISTATDLQGSTSTNSQSVNYPTSSNLPSHNHTITAGAANGFNATSYENRPLYLSVFYIMRVK
jgi:hypothetical protein